MHAPARLWAAIGAAAVAISGADYAGAQAASNADCVTIVSPAENSAVGGDGDIVGTVKTPAEGALWVFAHRTGLANWWPQGGGPAGVDGAGDWKVVATYGVDRDIGHQFEVKAMVVDGPTNAQLKAWVATADSTGKYPPVALPAALGGCVSKTVTVRKTN